MLLTFRLRLHFRSAAPSGCKSKSRPSRPASELARLAAVAERAQPPCLGWAKFVSVKGTLRATVYSPHQTAGKTNQTDAP